MCRFGARASVRRLTCGEGEAGDFFGLVRGLAGGVLVGVGELTERPPPASRRGEGDSCTGGGKMGCFATAAERRLAALLERVIRLFGGGDARPEAGLFRFKGEGFGDW